MNKHVVAVQSEFHTLSDSFQGLMSTLWKKKRAPINLTLPIKFLGVLFVSSSLAILTTLFKFSE